MEVMFSRHSATVVDAMWAVCCLPTAQRVTSQVEVHIWCLMRLLQMHSVAPVHCSISVLNFVRSLTQSFNNRIHDLSPIRNGFILTVSPSCNVGRSRADLS